MSESNKPPSKNAPKKREGIRDVAFAPFSIGDGVHLVATQAMVW